MNNAAYDHKGLKCGLKITGILMALILAFSVLQWGIASDWGNIRISRVTFVSEGGSQQSGVMFVPKGVSAQNPAPAIINYHGRNNSSYNMINWAIEEARRGYIVLNADLAGTLETTVNIDSTTDNLAVGPVEYMESLDMVSEISLTGHSMANLSLQVVENRENEFKPKLKNIVGVGGAFFYSVTGNSFPSQTNYMIIEATADLYEMSVLGGTPNARAMITELSGLGNAMENDTLYGDPTAGTAFQYTEIAGMSHQGLLYDKQTISTILDFIELSSPAPNPIDTSDMIFLTYLLCSAVAFVLFLFLIPSLAYTFTRLPIIYGIINVPLNHSNGKSGKKWATHLITDLAIPVALFVPVTSWAKNFPTDFFGSLWVNQIFLWLVACSLVGIVLLIVRYYKKSRETRLTAADFGFGTSDEKMFNGQRILCAAGITIAVATICYLWLDILMSVTGLDYQFFSMPGQIVRMTPERFIYALRYLLMMIPVYFMINVNVATARRLKSTGNETLDTVRAVLINILLSAGVLTTLVIIQFVGVRVIGTGATPFSQKYWDSISYGWTFPFMMSLASGTSAFMHRKTGNVWTGMMVAWVMAIFITVMQCCLVPAANVA
ncbi:MAG: acetylxylan esterase [Clostridiales bacterium]|nr:acetylxylan esterase [Clostridiales bacterium]